MCALVGCSFINNSIICKKFTFGTFLFPEQWLNVVMENSSPTVIPLACTMHDANTTYKETTNAKCTNLETNSENIISNASVDRINEPYVGMGFNSLCDAENFYKVFAKQQGFGIRIRTSQTGFRSNEIRSRIYVCCFEGHHKRDSQIEESTNKEEKMRRRCSTIRTGCGALFKIARVKNSTTWVVKSFKNEHNHSMISPKSVSYLRCHRKMTSTVKSLVEKFEEEGIPTGKVASIFCNVDQQFSNRDCWNHLRNLRRKDLDNGDAQAVLSYFKKKQAENPNFFYAIQCDCDARLVNLFWVDARSRLAYEYFGDVVTFDTTYKTNKYNMPFAPFVGLNHHRQSILFGCALLQDESEQSFIWLFETWLEAMHGKSPISVITDQDLAIGAAVRKMFPRARHRLCLWHIKKKFPEKLSHIYHKNSDFKRELKRCIRNSPSIEEFERDWHELMITNGLEENDWLQGLYKIRELWIPVYNRRTFFAGMNTTQRSESINAFFDSFVDSTTSLKEFVTKYEKAVDNRYDKEKKEDFDSRHKSRILKIGSKIEQHAASIYTRNIFNIFQDEFVKSFHFTREKVEKNGSVCQYKVLSCFDLKDNFVVCLDLDSKAGSCGCHLFEFMGILCRHMLAVFHFENIFEFPSH